MDIDWADIAEQQYAATHSYEPQLPAPDLPVHTSQKLFESSALGQDSSLGDRFFRMKAKKKGDAFVETCIQTKPQLKPKPKTIFETLPDGGVGLCTNDEEGSIIPLEGDCLPDDLTSLEDLRAWQRSQDQISTGVVSPLTANDPAEVCKPLPTAGSTTVGSFAQPHLPLKPAEAKARAQLLDLVKVLGRKPSRRELMSFARCGTDTAIGVLAAVFSLNSLGPMSAEDDLIFPYIFEWVYGFEREKCNPSTTDRKIGHAFIDGPLQQQIEDAAQGLFNRYPGQVHMLSGTVSADSELSYLSVAISSHYAQERVIELIGQHLGIDDPQFSLAWEIADDTHRLHWHAFIHAPSLSMTKDDLRKIWLTVLDEVSSLTNISPYLMRDGSLIERDQVNVHIHPNFVPPSIGKFDFCYIAKSCKSKTPRKLSLLGGASVSPISWGFTY
jgi:hypothetical protein